jgi:hypothetical protein
MGDAGEAQHRNGGRTFALLILIAVVVSVFLPALLQGGLLAPNDGVSYFVPVFAGGQHLWDPYLMSGFPAVGDPQTMFWYPPARLLSAFASPPALPAMWNLFVILAYVLGASFMARYLLEVTGARGAALVAGWTFALGGFLIARLSQVAVVHSAIWAPLALLGLEKMRSDPSARWVLLTAGAVALSALAGHPQTHLYSLLVLAPYALVSLSSASGSRGALALRAAVALLLGAAMGAVLFVPARELADLSLRSEIAKDAYLRVALPAEQWPQLLLPFVFGGMDVPYQGRWFLWEVTAYTGLLPLVFALTAVLSVRRRVVLFFTAVAVLSLLLALGSDTPLGPLTYRIPVLNLFRGLGRHLFEFALAVSVLAGLGFAEFFSADPLRRTRARRRATRVSLPVVVVLLVVAVVFAQSRLEVSLSTLVARPSVWVQLLHFALAVVVIAAAARFSSVNHGAAFCLIAIVLDLGSFATIHEGRKRAVPAVEFAQPAAIELQRQSLAEGHHRWTPFLGVYGPVETALPNRSRIWRLESTSGYNPLQLQRYVDFLDLDRDGRPSWRAIGTEHRGLDLLSAKILAVKSMPLENVRQIAALPRWHVLGQTDSVVYFENRDVLPRAWTVREIRRAPAGEVLVAVRTGLHADGASFDPREVALVERVPEEGMPADRLAPRAFASRRIVLSHLEPGRIRYEIGPGGEGFAVLSEIYHPGWRAFGDGEEIPITPCNYVLCGVALPAGVNHLELRFQPRSLVIGGTVSAASLITLLTFAVWSRITRNRSARR